MVVATPNLGTTCVVSRHHLFGSENKRCKHCWGTLVGSDECFLTSTLIRKKYKGFAITNAQSNYAAMVVGHGL